MRPLPSRVALDREIVRREGLHGFVRRAWPIIEPAAKFADGWHLKLICAHLEAVSRGELKRLIINIPPGMGKSSLVCVLWPAWDWLAHPERKFFFTSYSQKLSRRDSRATHALVSSTWYQERWPTRIDHGKTESADDWSVIGGGQRFASTCPKGQGTGWHPHVKVADDPNPPRDAAGGKGVTATALDAVAEYWSGTMGSRGDPETVAEVVIQQRVHEADLSGVLLDAGGYTHLRLPMEYDSSEPCETPWGKDPRRKDGELLCPARRGRAAVEALKKSLRTPSNIAAQLDQRPHAKGGGTFRRQWFKPWRSLPPIDELILYQMWDCNFGDGETPDPVCGQTWALHIPTASMYLLHLRWGRWDLFETLENVAEMAALFPTALWHGVEAKANGPAVVQLLRGKIPGMVAVNRGNKSTRAHAASAVWEGGNAYVPADPMGSLDLARFGGEGVLEWQGRTVEDFVDEHIGWPHRRLDDQVDCGSHVLVEMAEQIPDVSGYRDYVQGLREMAG